MNVNPIAALLNLPATGDKTVFTVAGADFELYHARPDACVCETLYRVNPGHGVGNPGFSLTWTPEAHHAMQLGQYLAGRPGVKRAEAEALVRSFVEA